MNLKMMVAHFDRRNKMNVEIYNKWAAMLKRCSEIYHISHLTYKDCYVCDEWLTFSNFKSWMETQDWEGKDLDKDLLIYSNKMYSPNTCCFISPVINKFLTKRQNERGLYPLGVSYRNKLADMVNEFTSPFRARVSITTKHQTHLGYFKTPEEAHRAWQKAKAALAFDLALEQTDERVKQGLMRVYEKILSDYEQGLETKDF